MKTRQKSTAILASFLAVALAICVVPGIRTASASPLFADHEVLELTMELDFDDLCTDPGEEGCGAAPATLVYRESDGTLHRFAISYRTRARWREDTGDCAFPGLFVHFEEEAVAGTVFEGQSTLPLTSHCQHFRRQYHGYAVLEYLAYRIYNLVTEDSVRVRLARIAYRDTGSRRRYERYGFFSEHFRHAAERMNADWFETDRLDPRETDPTELATLSVFQYMIGNLDWSVVQPHNIELFRRPDGTVVGVPFDFDYAGLVDAEYAAAPSFLNLRSVRSREYRGFCRPDIRWDDIFATFENIRSEVKELVRGLEGLSRGERRRAGHFLDSFYKTLTSESKRQDRIIDSCRSMPDSD